MLSLEEHVKFLLKLPEVRILLLQNMIFLLGCICAPCCHVFGYYGANQQVVVTECIAQDAKYLLAELLELFLLPRVDERNLDGVIVNQGRPMRIEHRYQALFTFER